MVRDSYPEETMILRNILGTNKREHIALYSLASIANLLLSVPQYQAVKDALQLGIYPRGVTGTLVSQYASTTGLVLELATEVLIFQGIMTVLTVGIAVVASTLTRAKRQYSVLAILVASYLAYHLGGKFLNTLSWIGVLEISGVNVGNVYANLFWFGLLSTICYFLSILVLRRSYGNLARTLPTRGI